MLSFNSLPFTSRASLKASMKAIDKTNFVRLLDVILIGPLMIYSASRAQLTPIQQNILLLSGIGTILYNGYNLLNSTQA